MKLLSSLSAKMSPTDLISTTLLKECSGVFVTIITKLTNLSFPEGIFSSLFKLDHTTSEEAGP